MLAVQEIDVFIQASHILRRVSLEVREREVVCLIGRNGAGKTTTLRTIMGYHRPWGGVIRFNDVALHERRTFEIARLGLGFAPEESGIFPDLTVGENIEISTWTRPGGRPAAMGAAAVSSGVASPRSRSSKPSRPVCESCSMARASDWPIPLYFISPSKPSLARIWCAGRSSCRRFCAAVK